MPKLIAPARALLCAARILAAPALAAPALASPALASPPPVRTIDSGVPLALANEALAQSFDACAAKGFKIAAAIVDADGVVKIAARGDASPIHSQRFAFRKAFTLVSMGPMFGAESSGALIARINAANPVGLAQISSGTSDLLFLPGAVLLRSGGQPVAALGVSGAPSSAEDEVCAAAGRDAIQRRLDALAAPGELGAK